MKTKGFSLIELMIVVAITSILAAVAIPSLSRYIKKSKTSEAVTNIRKVYDGEVSYYQEEHVLSSGVAASKAFVWLPSVPAFPPTRDKQYGNFEAYNWPLVKFGADGPVHYIYSVWVCPEVGPPAPSVPALTCPPPANSLAAFAARAQGDLDGDSVYSFFERKATVDPNTGEITGDGAVYILDGLE